MITKERIKTIQSMSAPSKLIHEEELSEILTLALKGLAAEKLENALTEIQDEPYGKHAVVHDDGSHGNQFPAWARIVCFKALEQYREENDL